jgi:hypothetical protein
LAGYWNATGLLDHLVYPNDVIARHMQNDSSGFDEAGLAYLMRGLMDLTGIEFDVEGRLRSGAKECTGFAQMAVVAAQSVSYTACASACCG